MSHRFSDAGGYERATGRFSRQIARQFVPWLGVRRDARWLDCGCGTGALTSAVIDLAWAGEVIGIDSSEAFLENARRSCPGVRFETGSAMAMPFPDGRFDATVAGCLLHHLEQPEGALGEMVRVTAPGGTVGAYEWDGGLRLHRLYWEAAQAEGLAAEGAGEQGRLGSAHELGAFFAGGGLGTVQTARFEAVVEFESFDDWWDTVLGRRAQVCEHHSGLAPERQAAVRRRAAELAGSGPLQVVAGAWGVRGRR